MLDKDTIQNHTISRRSFIIGATKIGLFFLLGCKLFYMQFVKKDEYKTLSDKNRIRIVAIPPLRGQIFDSNKQLLAKNDSCFQLFLEKSGRPQYKKEIEFLKNLLDLDDEQIIELDRNVQKAGYKTPGIIIDALDRTHLAIIEERISEFKTIYVDTGYVRSYPLGSSCAHVIGYLSKSTKLSSVELSPDMDKNFKLGVSGIERYYNHKMVGKFGHKQLEVNAAGRYVRSISENPSTGGDDIYLNLDSRLQQKIQELISIQGTSVVMMNCKTGGVISINSSPSFEPNNFVKLSKKYWNELTSNPYHPLINKTIHSLYPPGSVFKLIVVLAALEDGYDPKTKVSCTSIAALGGNSFRCASRAGHGLISLDHAVKVSCNHYIYHLAKQLGADKIIDMASRFGFGDITGIDFPDEKSGFLPSREWKRERIGSRWTMGDTLNLSIGQGFLLCTPLQIARFITAIATGGKLFTPQIMQGEANYKMINIKEENIKLLQSYLYKVVNEVGGTGYRGKLNIDGKEMVGKTGTAQVQAKKNASDNLSRQDISWHKRNHSIFAGYGPFHNPEYSICVYYDHGGDGGKAAAVVAKDIMEIAFSL